MRPMVFRRLSTACGGAAVGVAPTDRRVALLVLLWLDVDGAPSLAHDLDTSDNRLRCAG
jgi:hypothetical protein